MRSKNWKTLEKRRERERDFYRKKEQDEEKAEELLLKC
jgi:hypothetical protein